MAYLPNEQNKLQRGTSGHINDGSPETLHRFLRSSLKFYFWVFLFGFDETFMFAVQITPMEPLESFFDDSILQEIFLRKEKKIGKSST